MKRAVLIIGLLIAVSCKASTIRDSISECWMKSQMSLHEEGFRLDSHDGQVITVWVPAGRATRSHIDIPVGPETIAVFHTHSGELNYKPSPEDIQTAKSLNLYVYVISAHAVWRTDPNGSIEKFAER